MRAPVFFLIFLALIAVVVTAVLLLSSNPVEGGVGDELESVVPPAADTGGSLATVGQNIATVAMSSISGRVVDTTGAGIARAIIEYGDEQIGMTESDGSFTRVGVPSKRGVTSLTFTGDEWLAPVIYDLDLSARPGPSTLRLKPGENAIGTIKLSVSGAVDGRVVDDRGYPVEGARIFTAGTAGRRAMVETNAAGSFTLQRVKPGRITLIAALEGRRATFDGLFVDPRKTVSAGELKLPRLPQDRALRGRVLNSADGGPVAGARVTLLHDVLDSGFSKETFSNLDGRFEIIGIRDPLKMVEVEAEGNGYPKLKFGPFQAESDKLILSLEGGPRFELFVTDALSGAPIEQVGVWSCTPLKTEDLLPPVRKHPGGLVPLFASAPNRTRVVVNAPGYPLFEGIVDYTKNRPEIRLPPPGVVKVIVTKGGRPAVGINTFLSYTKTQGGSIFSGMMRDLNIATVATFEARVGPDGSDLGRVTPELRARPEDRTRRTGADGVVTFTTIPPGRYSVIAEDAGGRRSRSATFEVVPGRTVEINTLITNPGQLTGVVTAANPADMTVVIRREDGADPNFRMSASPTGDGLFTISSLEPGRYRAAPQFKGESGGNSMFLSPAAVDFTITPDNTTHITISSGAEGRGNIDARVDVVGSNPPRLEARWVRLDPSPAKSGPMFQLEPGKNFIISDVPHGNVAVDILYENIIVGRIGPAELRPGGTAMLSGAVRLGSVRVRVGARSGSGQVQVEIQLPELAGRVARSADASGELVIYCGEGPVSATARVDGKVRESRGTVAAGGETFLELR